MRSFVVPLIVVCVAMAGCTTSHENCGPRAALAAHMGPGVDGPGPGVIPAQYYGQGEAMAPAASQIAFAGPEGSTIVWDVSAPGAFDSAPLTCPARYDFPQGEIYRLKLGSLPGRPGVELYPTIEVATAVPRTEAFLAHAPIPVEFTQEDLDQVLSGNFVTKVIYLPDPEFQELAVAGVGTLVSTRLDPGVDPITEASHRGAILAVVRIGNKDLQLSGGQPQAGAIAPASYQTPNGCNRSAAAPLPMGIQANATAGVPMSHVVGVTAPQYGSPSCATAVGLPGPPCLPLGAPAGLEKVVYRHCLACPIKPKPTEHVCVDVLNVPGGCVKGKCADKSCCKNGETVESDRVVGGTTQTMAPAATNMPTAAQNCNQQ